MVGSVLLGWVGRRPPSSVSVSLAAVRSLGPCAAGWAWAPSLAPSLSLFCWGLRERRAGRWGLVWEEYRHRYEEELLLSGDAEQALAGIVRRLSAGETVLLGCWCRSGASCHLAALGSRLLALGFEVRDLREDF